MHKDEVVCTARSADGNYAFSAGKDATIFVYKLSEHFPGIKRAPVNVMKESEKDLNEEKKSHRSSNISSESQSDDMETNDNMNNNNMN
eukprot:CAMPEP_0176360422 /NCGR_PEP_ID=MMETSP0126-20121128/17079_1 /TAXON_ID=141414 ORGANISM="Strombidinopsis acuminatum, Strain SPMC142" /NCGR_SAMPLE_ID=MMETSP0126 /ASSEMBLY_ACC=CAM_ASM_000229 /LENGTH=87 /DNA_ID=CAMNT_0017715657 /DNA_START=62 /DNA_END=325 /DNA_ORIENTATION=+